MSYQVLARKWRPQTFEEVVGQETVTRTLQNAIQSGRVAHAFLFSGVRGVGKTTTARILAKALNCQRGPTPHPCGECISCQEIAAGNSVDVLEIDAASNTGVDNIRELRENVRYGTARDRFKIFIIDEVHMLSNAAFNALLKTLEEPPPHVKFILATTEHHKIPATVTSRCQQFDFKSIPFRLILERLRLMAREEGIEISDYALTAVASAAQGSMRDAQSTLDQIIAFCGRTVRDDDVRALLGVVDDQLLTSLVNAVLQRDRKVLLQGLQQVAEYGIEAQNFCRRLIGYVRSLLVCKVAGWDEQLLHLSDSQKEAVLGQAEQFSELDLIRFYDLLNRTENELRWNPHPYVHLEMALVKLIELAQLPALEQVISQLESGQWRREGSPLMTGRSSAPARTPSLFESDAKGKSPSSAPVSPATASPVSPTTPPAAARQAQPPELPAEKTVSADSQWLSKLLQVTQMESIRLYSSLQHAAKILFENGTLSITFPAAEQIHYTMVAEAEGLAKLRELCAKITGSQPEIDVRLEKVAVQEASSDPIDDPNVKAFIEKFPGKVMVERKRGD